MATKFFHFLPVKIEKL